MARRRLIAGSRALTGPNRKLRLPNSYGKRSRTIAIPERVSSRSAHWLATKGMPVGTPNRRRRIGATMNRWNRRLSGRVLDNPGHWDYDRIHKSLRYRRARVFDERSGEHHGRRIDQLKRHPAWLKKMDEIDAYNRYLHSERMLRKWD
jgi:hypothetical protein